MSLESQHHVRVLLVDDEHKLTDLLRLELDVEGYDVDVASDGASGLIRSRTEPTPDLIILDWNLPDFSGIDICQRIRAGEITIPILMLTGHEEITDRVKALDAGVDDYLIKPFSIDELMARLRAMHRRAETFSPRRRLRRQRNSQGRRPQHEHANPGCDAGRSCDPTVGEGIRPAEFPDAGRRPRA